MKKDKMLPLNCIRPKFPLTITSCVNWWYVRHRYVCCASICEIFIINNSPVEERQYGYWIQWTFDQRKIQKDIKDMEMVNLPVGNIWYFPSVTKTKKKYTKDVFKL